MNNDWRGLIDDDITRKNDITWYPFHFKESNTVPSLIFLNQKCFTYTIIFNRFFLHNVTFLFIDAENSFKILYKSDVSMLDPIAFMELHFHTFLPLHISGYINRWKSFGILLNDLILAHPMTLFSSTSLF